MDRLSDVQKNEILAKFAEMRNADRISRIAQSVPNVVTDLQRFNREACLAVIAGLMTDPACHANHIRLEALTHVVLLNAAGTSTPSRIDLDRRLNLELGKAPIKDFEDPVEDVFIANVATQNGNRSIFTGVWETPDFWLQQLIDVLSHAPARPPLDRLRAEVNALLKLSQEVARRATLKRYDLADAEPWGRVELADDISLQHGTGQRIQGILSAVVCVRRTYDRCCEFRCDPISELEVNSGIDCSAPLA